MYKRICILIFSIYSFLFSLHAQEDWQFRHIDVSSGLSNNQVTAIYKDSRGFMWFGTFSGLNRYDGYRINHYPKDSQYSLGGEEINQIQEDANGNLWLKVKTSYILYNWEKDYLIHDIESVLQQMGINGNYPEYIYLDSQKDVWVYDKRQIYYYSFTTNTLTIIEQSDSPETLSPGEITGITNQQNNYYFIHRSGLIECLDIHTGRITERDEYLVKHSNLENEVLMITLDSEQDIWVYSKASKGVWRKNNQKNRWEHFSTTTPGRTLSHDFINGVIDDLNGNIWIVTDHGGVNIYNKTTGKNAVVKNDPDISTSICSNGIISIFRDNDGIIWLGSFKKGASYYSDVTQKFSPNYIRGTGKSIHTYYISVIAEDTEGNRWLGTDGEGLLRVDAQTGHSTLYRKEESPNSLSGNNIVSILYDSNKRLWLGTYLDGMACYENGKFTRYEIDKTSNPLADKNVWDIEEDQQGNIWIGTLQDGLQMFDPETNQFVSYKTDESLIEPDCILDLYCNRGRYLYIATVYGLGIMDTETRKSEKINGTRKGHMAFSDQFMNCVYKDTRGLLWIGGNHGINIYNEREDSIVYIDKSDGLYDNIVRGIVEDDNKNMWILTSSGLTNIIVNGNPLLKTYEYTFHTYDENDGLFGRFFDGRSIYKNKKGEILIGGSGGYNLFDPGRLMYNQFIPKVTFTGLIVGNQRIQTDSIYNKRIIFDKNIIDIDKVELDHSDNIFFIEYSALDFSLPQKTQYAYMLEGLNTDWIYTHESRIGFTNLNPGKYNLKIKAANSDGFWNETPTHLQIIIHPPFWRSYMAFTLYSLATLLIVGYIIYQNRRKQADKLRVQRIEMEAERQHKVNEMKLRFFTNISHDFRTPLSLIISPVEKMIEDYQDSPVAARLEIIHKNALQLLNQVNQLLDFRKLDVKGENLNLSYGDYIAFIKEVSESFVAFAERKDIHLTFESEINKLEMAFDKDKIRKIVMNLLSNAFKYTESGGRVAIHIQPVNTQNNSTDIQVKVCDTGIGIPDGDKPFIFDRFYQVLQPKMNSGSGIGLHIVQEFIKLHEGKIEIEDNTPKGTIFTFTIPVKSLPVELANPPLSVTQTEEEEEEEEKRRIDSADKESIPVILIVEDNHDFRKFVSDSLKDSYHILEATNGEEALTLLRKESVNIILSDVMMPVMDGLELCHKVKNDIHLSHIPIILLTARATDEHKLEGLKEGADDYIPKPFNLNVLQLRIHKFLDWNKKSHEKFKKTMDINPSEITISSLDEQLIEKAIRIVEENMISPTFSVEELSIMLGMSRGHLYKKLLNITGNTPIEFIRILRLKRAMQLLGKSQMNISEIAYQVGFNSPKVFTKYFKEEYHMSPSEYLKSIKSGY